MVDEWRIARVALGLKPKKMLYGYKRLQVINVQANQKMMSNEWMNG